MGPLATNCCLLVQAQYCTCPMTNRIPTQLTTLLVFEPCKNTALQQTYRHPNRKTSIVLLGAKAYKSPHRDGTIPRGRGFAKGHVSIYKNLPFKSSTKISPPVCLQGNMMIPAVQVSQDTNDLLQILRHISSPMYNILKLQSGALPFATLLQTFFFQV